MADIAEQICLAVDQIVLERLKNIKYDTTIVATIVDNKHAADYKYTCSNGSAQFVAFSKDTTYKINDSVQVTIPNGDYDQQKIIIGKYVADDETPYVFTQPFDTIIDVSANLIDEEVSAKGLIANNEYDTGRHMDEVLMWSKVFSEGFYDFERLGIQGQFRSRIKSLKPVSGDYGYRLEILSSRDEIVSNGSVPEIAFIYSAILNKEEYGIGPLNTIPESWFEKVVDELGLTITETEKTFKEAYIQSFNAEYEIDKFSNKCKNMVKALLYANAQLTELYLSSADMYGNPYNFQSFFEQEKVYDISSLNAIFGMSLYFYEESGSFFNEDGKPIPYTYQSGGKRDPNLHTKDPYICLGYDLSDFDSEQVLLFTTDGTTYKTRDEVAVSDNRKHIRLRWLHLFENGNISVVSEASQLEGYEIRWYRYKMGAPSADEYSGVYWTAIEKTDDWFNYTLDPAPNTSVEQIKAIVLFDGKVIRSNILTFSNEVEVANTATAEVISGLSIWCKDGSYGNYCRYGQNNELMDSIQPNEKIQTITANTVFTFEARFADKTLLADEYNVDQVALPLQEAKEITWEIPLQNSMIIVQGFNYSYPIYDNEWANADKTIPNYEVIYANDDLNNGARYKQDGFYSDAVIKVRGNSIFITRKGVEDGSINALQDYRINKTFNASALNNTVKCTVLKNGLIYSATKELTFGIMGTNGTDATIVIDFDNNKTALTANDTEDLLKVTAHLYDSSHREIDFHDETNKNIRCYWSWKHYSLNDGEEVKLTQRLNADYVEVDNTIPKNVCYLSHTTPLSIAANSKYFLVLKVTVTGFGDYNLIAYKAVPLRANRQYRNIIGPTEIIYNTTGHPTYYKDKFSLWWCADASKITEFDTVTDETAVSNISSNWKIHNPYLEELNLIGTISNNILKPANVYIKNADPYGAYCFLNTADGGTSEPVWIQPFVIMQNEYPSATINQWNGKEVQIEYDKGYILSPAIAAGRKDKSNRFYGVMIGDWSNTPTADDLTKQTGIYGFHAGALSFAFKEDGTAFIGKSGRGRIELNGNNGTLKSSAWTEENETGMYLDLDDGILKLQREGGFDQIRIDDAGDYRTGTYYVQKITYAEVALDTPYDSSQVYFKKGLVPILAINEATFDRKKAAGILYYRAADIYNQCKPTDEYSDTNEYYQHTYVEATGLTAETFIPTNYYIKDGDKYVKCSTTSTFDENTTYYTQSKGLSRVYPTKEQYEADPSKYFIYTKGNIVKAAPNLAYNADYEYYQEGYVEQNYGVSPPPSTWNTSEDENLVDGEHYYILTGMEYVISNDPYDPGEIYYEDNRSESDRYITLSAKTTQYPLAIGTNVNPSSRKFRVDWDGTCFIQDGVFSGTIDAESGTLGDLTLYGTLSVENGGHIDIDREGYMYVGTSGYIELGKNAYITMNKGGYIELDARGGYISSVKESLTDFEHEGFWLDIDGLNIGGSNNYFLATSKYTGFYSDKGAIRISGYGFDLYPDVTAGSSYNIFSKYKEGSIHIGWSTGYDYSYPYIRLGQGTFAEGDNVLTDAGLVKKYGSGMWIGAYGRNLSGTSPESDTDAKVGIFCCSGSKGSEHTVYRCEVINNTRVFEPARYARFA